VPSFEFLRARVEDPSPNAALAQAPAVPWKDKRHLSSHFPSVDDLIQKRHQE
jgi:hypothetical protein